MAKQAIVQLESASIFSYNRPYFAEKKNKESDADYEERTWQQRMHLDESDRAYIPPMMLKNCMAGVAKYLSMKTKGQATFTKHFAAGILVVDPSILINPKTNEPIYKDEIRGDKVFVPSNGIAGGGKRVWKTFPCIDSWKTEATFYILDDIITEPVFLEHLKQAGQLIGLGRFRPRNNGYYGRFRVTGYQWVDEFVAA